MVSALLALSLIAPGQAFARSYGEALLAATATRHPALAALRIHVTGKDGSPILATFRWSDPRPQGTVVPLSNAMGEPIGSVALRFRHRRAGGAGVIAAELARRIYAADMLAEDDPFVPGTRGAPVAQAIVERMIAAHPDLVTLAMHVTPPGQASNVIIASSFGRIGKAADEDDTHVIADGATLREVTSGGRRIAVELPMHDRAGGVIGALSTSFTVTPGRDPRDVERQAIALRDEIARETPSLATLTRPTTR